MRCSASLVRSLSIVTAFTVLSAMASAPIAAQPVSLAVDGRVNANPTIAALDNVVAVAWSAATVQSMDIFAAVSRDGGKTFGAPTQVNTVANDARVSGEEPPRIALVPKKGGMPEVVVVWTAKAGTTTKLQSARSSDGGKTFSAAKTVPGSDGDGQRGWQSMAVSASGKVMVLWLDHREVAAVPMVHQHDSTKPMPKADPTERAGLSQLYFGRLDASPSASALKITRSVCYCCKTSLVSNGSNVYAVWRHVYPGSQRDIAFAMSTDDGKTFTAPLRVSEDKWQIDGCPDNGPSMAIDAKRALHVVWPTPEDGKNVGALSLFYAMSKDGKSFTPRVKIPTRGPAGHVQVSIGADGAPVIAWDEIVDATRRLSFATVRVDASGRASVVNIPSVDASAGQWYPALASSTRGAYATWIRQSERTSAIGVAFVR